jgi:hypothetical protein
MEFQKTTFSYNEVERALAKAFRIPKNGMGFLRGRLNNFRKLGFAESPGTGRKITYRRANIFQWALGLELVQFGVDPRLIGGFVTVFIWPRAGEHLLNDGPDRLLVFYPNSLWWGRDDMPPDYLPGFLCSVVDSLSQLEDLARSRPHHNFHYDLLCSRTGVINLGRLRRDVEQALANPN